MKEAFKTPRPGFPYYTDPIVYEEGFFKDPADELKFLEKVGAEVERMKKARLAKRQSKAKVRK